MSPEQIEALARELEGILFRGYATKITDAGMLFREMCVEAKLLRQKLRERLAPPPTKPSVPPQQKEPPK